MKRKNNKRKKLIILLILIVLIIIIILIGYKISLKKAKDDYGYEIMGVYKPAELEAEENSTEGFVFKNIDILNNFRGDLPVSTITKKMKDILINEIPEIIEETEDFSEEELKEYYNENMDDIKNKLRIANEQSFLNMVESFKEIDDLENFNVCEFISGEKVSFKYVHASGDVITGIIEGEHSKTFILEF